VKLASMMDVDFLSRHFIIVGEHVRPAVGRTPNTSELGVDRAQVL